MLITAGVDAGSRAIKMALWDDEQGILAMQWCDQGVQQNALARALYDKMLIQADHTADNVDRIVATGYGRHRVDFADSVVTEITCHALGVRAVCPEARTIIEIGGQDSKLIHLGSHGEVRDFSMNDRCAAGTGRFLEVIATRLEHDLNALGTLAAISREPATISSMCVVFAETEIVGLLADGVASADIVAGVMQAIAARIASMAGPRIKEPVIFTGGVALTPGMRDCLAEALGVTIGIAPHPRFTGAAGAAIAARNERMP